jgi:uncharacterized RDD family membrane protein YckC
VPFCIKCGKELEAGAAFCPRCGTPVAGPGAGVASQGAAVSGIDSVIKEPAAQEYWVQRIVAYVIDAVIVYLALGILAVVYALPFFFIAGINAMAAMFVGVLSFVAGIVLVLYFVFFEMWAGTSLGKRAMGLVVRSKSGKNPSLVEAFARNISKIYWILLLLDIIVGLATSKAYTQKFSDQFAGTSVVKRQASGPLA